MKKKEEYVMETGNKEKEYEKEYKERWKQYVMYSNYVKWMKGWWKEVRQQSKVRRYVFVFAYMLFTIIFVSLQCAHYESVASEDNASGSKYSSTLHSKNAGSLTPAQKSMAELYDDNGGRIYGSWYPMAKMFGNLCDINCAFIVLPVCRSFIASLYNISTNQRMSSRAVRFCLSFMPLDKAMQFHKLCALLSALGAVLHTWAHYNHYSQVPKTYQTVFGPTVWISGVLLLVAMQLLYSTSSESVRRGKFEMFWYTHHVFVVFFAALLFHGRNSWNPNFWKCIKKDSISS
ncbi:NADPH oxidase [Reticulomyxa filosa]|uniref:NADPH oxidase n=1 Tax=Reticulomyxa filosa TaxID=46433 RepID=X6NIW0_RETFI|nr:NADPH oxidase [Reticulomyxa filosa]|eukprot:ETO25896.1 NADPH oxidase [Reticulomyxa filosa]